MRYRKLDANGDYTIGQGDGNFHTDTPEAVAQACKTRLQLRAGEWFLDTRIGTPYDSQILGAGTISKYNFAIQDVITNTIGVKSILAYNSRVDPKTREASVACTIDTIYGTASFEQPL